MRVCDGKREGGRERVLLCVCERVCVREKEREKAIAAILKLRYGVGSVRLQHTATHCNTLQHNRNTEY